MKKIISKIKKLNWLNIFYNFIINSIFIMAGLSSMNIYFLIFSHVNGLLVIKNHCYFVNFIILIFYILFFISFLILKLFERNKNKVIKDENKI